MEARVKAQIEEMKAHLEEEVRHNTPYMTNQELMHIIRGHDQKVARIFQELDQRTRQILQSLDEPLVDTTLGPEGGDLGRESRKVGILPKKACVAKYGVPPPKKIVRKRRLAKS